MAVVLVGSLAVALPELAPVIRDRLGLAASPAPDATRLDEKFGRLPLRFEANHGQTDAEVAFTARGSGFGLYLTKQEAVVSLAPTAEEGRDAGVLRMRFAGASPDMQVTGADRQPGVTNYLLGDDPAAWRTGVPGFGRVEYEQVYPGIDLVFYGRGGHVEYDYAVAPGADPDDIALAFPGSERVSVAANGDLVVAIGGREVHQPKPVLFQGSGRNRRAVEGSFVVRDGVAGFRVGAYDRSRLLVIDPILTYSTFLGGSGADAATGVRVDGSGNAYITGTTASTNFPLQGALQGTNGGGTDAFVAKLNSAGTALVYSTYLGGSGTDSPTAIAIDGTGNAHVTGSTASTNFPLVNAAQAAKGSGTDAFAAKLNATGSALLWSTYLGAGTTNNDADVARGITVDGAGNASVVGETRSNNFPTSANAYQAAFGGGTCPTSASPPGSLTQCRDAFVTTYGSTGAVAYSSYLGGTNDDIAWAVAADSSNRMYVTGEARSTDFDIVVGAFQATHGGDTCAATFEPSRPCRDAFVSKLDPAVSGAGSLLYSTYLGGNTTSFLGESTDFGSGIAVDASGNAYVAGQTSTDNFPTLSPLQGSRAGEGDAFVTKLNSTATALVYSTYLGGPSSDNANGIDVDSTGAAHVAGTAGSGGFPVVDPVGGAGGNSDAFVAKLNAAGSAFEHSSYLGGHWSESGAAVATDGSGRTYAVGNTASGGFPSTAGNFPVTTGVQTVFGGPSVPAFGSGDAFAVKIEAPANPLDPVVTALGTTTGPAGGGATVVITGRNLTGATAVAFGATPAASFVPNSATQVTAVSPAGTAGTSAVVTVTTAQGTSAANPVAKFHFGAGTWTRTGSQTATRFAHTDTLLADGRVLSVGGRASSGGPALGTAEVFDPATGTWTATGPLTTPRFVHTATLLADGKVLVTGGFGTGLTTNAQHTLNSAELWDPTTGTWTLLANTLTVPRAIHMSVLLPNGKVLLGGGRTCTGPPPATCDFNFVTGTNELYDPTAQTFTATGSFVAVTARHTTQFVLLDNGLVLVPGGFPGNGTNTAELYDPATGTWAATGPMANARARPSVTKMADGRVLITSGFPNSIANLAEVYNPAAGTWSSAGTLTTGRFNASSVLLANGKVLLSGGGEGGATAELYNPATNSWTAEGVSTGPHGSGSSNSRNHDALLLTRNCGANCGKVLVSGNNGEPVADLYTPAGAEGLFHPLTPARILDTRTAAESGGATPIGTCTPSPCAKLGASGNPNTIEVQVTGMGGVPASGVSAVVMNVTATGPAGGAQFLKVYPSDATEPNASNLNYVDGQTVPNLVTVKVGPTGAVRITNNAGQVHAIADVAGWYTDSTGLTGSRFNSLTPARVLDTRTAAESGGATPIGTCTPSPCAKLGAAGNPNTIEVQVTGMGGVPAGAAAVVMNVTVTGAASGAQFLKVYPSDATEPNASNLNYVDGQTVPNLVTVKVGPTGKVKITNNGGQVHVIADVAGWYSSDLNILGGRFRTLTPARVLDTRTAAESGGATPIGTCTPSPCAKLGAAGNPNTIEVQVTGMGGVPAGAAAVVMNVTVAGPASGAQFLKVYPSDATEPNASNLNYVDGLTVPNLVAVKLGGTGAVKVTNNAGQVHVLADVAGWFGLGTD